LGYKGGIGGAVSGDDDVIAEPDAKMEEAAELEGWEK
jgi:hypothetical protein